MKNILRDKFFSIQYFNDEGIEDVIDTLKLDEKELIFEIEAGNYLIGQTENGKFYFYCEDTKVNNEITYNEVKRLLKQ